jgi:hypothetical protein
VRFGVPGFFASVPPRQATENDYDDDYEYEHDYNGEQVCWTALLLHAPSAAQDAFRRIVLVLVIRNRNRTRLFLSAATMMKKAGTP